MDEPFPSVKVEKLTNHHVDSVHQLILYDLFPHIIQHRQTEVSHFVFFVKNINHLTMVPPMLIYVL